MINDFAYLVNYHLALGIYMLVWKLIIWNYDFEIIYELLGDCFLFKSV